jgi:hypothetical protein
MKPRQGTARRAAQLPHSSPPLLRRTIRYAAAVKLIGRTNALGLLFCAGWRPEANSCTGLARKGYGKLRRSDVSAQPQFRQM